MILDEQSIHHNLQSYRSLMFVFDFVVSGGAKWRMDKGEFPINSCQSYGEKPIEVCERDFDHELRRMRGAPSSG